MPKRKYDDIFIELNDLTHSTFNNKSLNEESFNEESFKLSDEVIRLREEVIKLKTDQDKYKRQLINSHKAFIFQRELVDILMSII